MLETPQTWNRYAYTLNNPLRFIDPDGQTEGSPTNVEKRDQINKNATKKDGSTDYAYDKKKDDFGPNTNKCNKFVNDVASESGAKMEVTASDGTQRGPTAQEIANPAVDIPNWRPLGPGETPEPGDVAAYKLPQSQPGATGHSGVMIRDGQCGVTSIGASATQVGPPNATVFSQGRTDVDVQYRRYTGD